MPAPKPAPHPTRRFQIRITLEDIEPAIWRLVTVPADIPLLDLHTVVQLAMGWEDDHLHAFLADGMEYLTPEVGPPTTNAERDERHYRLQDLLAAPGQVIGYRYDFGDRWRHRIELVAITDGPGICDLLDGAGACPRENSGGNDIHQQLLDARRTAAPAWRPNTQIRAAMREITARRTPATTSYVHAQAVWVVAELGILGIRTSGCGYLPEHDLLYVDLHPLDASTLGGVPLPQDWQLVAATSDAAPDMGLPHRPSFPDPAMPRRLLHRGAVDPSAAAHLADAIRSAQPSMHQGPCNVSPAVRFSDVSDDRVRVDGDCSIEDLAALQQVIVSHRERLAYYERKRVEAEQRRALVTST